MNPSELSKIIDLYNKMDYDENHANDYKYNKENQLNLNEWFTFEGVDNSELDTVGYIKFLQQYQNTIANLEQYENFKTKSETAKHIELSIKYLNAFKEQDYKRAESVSQTFRWSHRMPLYEFIIMCYKLKYYKKSEVATDGRREKLLNLFLTVNYNPELTSYTNIQQHTCVHIDRYTSMVVYETSDIETVTDVISNSFHENSVPWKIRDIYVQEKILQKFTTILKSKLKPFESCYQEDNLLTESYTAAIGLAKEMGLQLITTYDQLDENLMKPTIIVGQNRSYFDKEINNIPLIINMNIFRTVKESIDMINRNNNLSISVWTENISTAYEFISKVNTNCIWINSNGIFNTKIPFPFNQLTLMSIGSTENPSFGIREQENNIEFQCFQNGVNSTQINSKDTNYFKITKTILVNSVNVDLYILTDILNKPEDFQNFISLGNYKTVVIPFGVTFGN